MTNERVPGLSGKETVILEMLLESKEMYGLELVDASAGRLKRGTVYVTLKRMEDKGYVTSRPEPSRAGSIGLPRRLYEATAAGRRLYEVCMLVRAKLNLAPAR
jgi:PadR family transcriptional regulator PadR